MSDESLNLRDDVENHRYVAELDDEVAAFAVYHLRKGQRYFFVHTVVEPPFEGRSIGSKLVRYALDDVRAKGAKIVPLCPFVAGWLERHPEYKDLVDEEITARINR